jgi:hypothetical protein
MIATDTIVLTPVLPPDMEEETAANDDFPDDAADVVPEVFGGAPDPTGHSITPPAAVHDQAPEPMAAEAVAPREPAGSAIADPDLGESSGEPYEPDLERREKFFARLNRWGKKP